MARTPDQAIVDYLLANPHKTSREAGVEFHLHEVTIRKIAKANGLVCSRINTWHRAEVANGQ